MVWIPFGPRWPGDEGDAAVAPKGSSRTRCRSRGQVGVSGPQLVAEAVALHGFVVRGRVPLQLAQRGASASRSVSIATPAGAVTGSSPVSAGRRHRVGRRRYIGRVGRRARVRRASAAQVTRRWAPVTPAEYHGRGAHAAAAPAAARRRCAARPGPRGYPRAGRPSDCPSRRTPPRNLVAAGVRTTSSGRGAPERRRPRDRPSSEHTPCTGMRARRRARPRLPSPPAARGTARADTDHDRLGVRQRRPGVRARRQHPGRSSSPCLRRRGSPAGAGETASGRTRPRLRSRPVSRCSRASTSTRRAYERACGQLAPGRPGLSGRAPTVAP